MKKKKLLQNPIVVIVLCCGAASALVFNTILPLLQEQRGTETTAGPDTGSGAIMADEPALLSSGMPQSVDTASGVSGYADTVAKRLSTIGWERTTERNPFVPEDSSGGKRALLTESGSTVPIDPAEPVPVQRGSIVSKVRRVTPILPVGPRLNAVSRGAGGLVALIGSQMVRTGDVCSLGTVMSIDRSSVRIASRGGIRILHLSDNKQGAAP